MNHRWISSVYCFLVIVTAVFALSVRASMPEEEGEAEIGFGYQAWKVLNRTGQIIGVSEKNPDPGTIVFELASGMQIGHVGIVVNSEDLLRTVAAHPELDPRGVWPWRAKNMHHDHFVFHSDPRFRKIEDGGLGRGGVGWSTTIDFVGLGGSSTYENGVWKPVSDVAAIQPKEELSPESKDRLIQTILALYQKSVRNKLTYNFAQQMQSLDSHDGLPQRINCSEFVHYVFNEVGMKVGRPQKMKTLNLGMGRNMLRHYFRVAGLYKPEAWCVTPKSVMQAAVEDEQFNPAPEFEVCPVSTVDPTRTESEADILKAWKRASMWNDAWPFKVLNVLAVSEKPFEKNCFRQSFDDALRDCDADTHFYEPEPYFGAASGGGRSLQSKMLLAAGLVALGGLGVYGLTQAFASQ